MVLASKYLEENYPKKGVCLINDVLNNKDKKRSKLIQLNLNEKDLEGTLDLSDFFRLKELYCWKNKLTDLILPVNNQLKVLDCSKNQLKVLDVSDCLELEVLRCQENQLTYLIISPSSKLAEITCYNNQLTSLDLTDCANLKIIHCWRNWLVELLLPTTSQLIEINTGINLLNYFNYSILNPKTLIELCLFNNKLKSTDIAVFSKLVNLERLEIGNDNSWIKTSESNEFFGSLESLKNLTRLNYLDIANTNINQGLEHLPEPLKYFSHFSLAEYNLQINDIKKEISFLEGDWKNPSLWKRQGFTFQESKEWIVAGAKRDDYSFVAWLRDIKNHGLDWIENYKEDYQIFSERFKKYSLCVECQQPNTGEQWCKDCNNKHSDARIHQLNKSGNSQINEFINQYQLKATDANKFIEWIPYEQFEDVEYLAEGGFGKVYKAKWLVGSISHWDIKSNKWHREKKYYYEDEDKKKQDFELNKDKYKKYKNYHEIVLKILSNSQSNTDFLDEAAKHKIIDDWFNNIVPCYGLSQDSQTGNYLMVIKYLPERDIRNYLKKNNQELKEKIVQKKDLIQEIGELKTRIENLEDQLSMLKQNQSELDKQEKKLFQQIENKKSVLEKSTSSIKNKLKIENASSFEGKNEEHLINHQKIIDQKNEILTKLEKERNIFQEKLTNLFNNLPNEQEDFFKKIEDIKSELSKGVAPKEVNEVYRIKSELVELEEEFKNLVNIKSDYQEKISVLNRELKKNESKSEEENKKSDNLNSEIINFQINKFNQLLHIAQGLKDIHQKNLVHRDFHSGNILKGIEKTECLITDLGLCKPVDQITKEEKIFGVMPYVAPEVLQGQPYAQAADIYSFGVVAYELFAGLPPFYDRKHDVELGVEICQGLRPNFQIKIPQLLENLINHCWDKDPTKRPTSIELERKLRNLQSEISDYKKTELEKQFQSAEIHNQNLSIKKMFPDYQIHYGACYHSKLLPTQEITRILQSSNLLSCSTVVDQSSNTLILPTKQIAHLSKNSANQQQSLTLEIKKMEKEIGKLFTKEQKLLVSDFIKNQKKLIGNKKDREAKNQVREIENQLEQENFVNEEIEKIIDYCKRFFKSEQELEQESLEANVETFAIKNQ